MKRRIVITGMGVNCAAGSSVEEFYRSLHTNKTGISDCDLFETSNLSSSKFGEIKNLQDPKQYREKNRTEIIIKDLIGQLIADTGLDRDYFAKKGLRCHLSFATSVGTNFNLMKYIEEKREGNIQADLLPNMVNSLTGLFQKELSIRGGYDINSSACTAGGTAVGTAMSKIRNNKADMVVACAVDPITEFSTYGFYSLNNMSKSMCRPFNKERDGLTLGEGGAIFLLEEYEHALKRNAKIYCELLGYGIGNDAYHATSPDPTGEGAYRTLQMALSEGNIKGEAIDYINTHGTGTRHNDLMELEMIKKLNPSNKELYVNSIKSYVGHCLGAAAGVELVATVLSLVNEEVFATYGLEECIEDVPNVNAVKGKALKADISTAVSNSYAFAGNSTSLLLKKCS